MIFIISSTYWPFQMHSLAELMGIQTVSANCKYAHSVQWLNSMTNILAPGYPLRASRRSFVPLKIVVILRLILILTLRLVWILHAPAMALSVWWMCLIMLHTSRFALLKQLVDLEALQSLKSLQTRSLDFIEPYFRAILGATIDYNS